MKTFHQSALLLLLICTTLLSCTKEVTSTNTIVAGNEKVIMHLKTLIKSDDEFYILNQNIEYYKNDTFVPLNFNEFKYLFNQVKEGDTLIFRGPQGVFTLPPQIDTNLYLICTGTGVAPFRSMVHHIAHQQIPHQDIHLIFGCRKYTDCLYGHELKQLEQQLSGFHYHPSFSRETEIREGAYHGYVHPIYQNLLATQSNTNAHFYICGWKDMVDEARTHLQSLGIPKEQIHFELYG